MRTMFRQMGFSGVVLGAVIAFSGCGAGSGSSPGQQSQATDQQTSVQTTSPGGLDIEFNSIGAIDVRNLVLAQLNDALNQNLTAPLPGAMAGLAGEASLTPDGASIPITGLSVTLLFDPTRPGGEQCLGDAASALAEGANFEIQGGGVVAQLTFSWLDVFNGNSVNGSSMENNILNLWDQTAASNNTTGTVTNNNQTGVDFTTTNIGIVLTRLTQCQIDATDSGSGSSGGIPSTGWNISTNTGS